MSPVCLFHCNMSEKCRCDQMQNISGGWCWDYTSVVLGATCEALWKKEEFSSWLRWPFHQILHCSEDLSMCLGVSVTFCKEMEQNCWLAICSISPMAHQVNCRECPLHMDNTGWVGGSVASSNSAAPFGKGLPPSVAALKCCTWSLEDLDLFHGVSILQCNGTLYSTTLCRVQRNCSVTV